MDCSVGKYEQNPALQDVDAWSRQDSVLSQVQSLFCCGVGPIVIVFFLCRHLGFCYACWYTAIRPIYRVAAQISCFLVSVGFAFRLVS